MNTPSEQNWMKRTKWLTQALIVSGTLNFGLLGTFVYFVLKEKQNSVAIDHKPVSKDNSKNAFLTTNEKLLRSYSALSFQELLLRLENKDHVEEGYTKRDLALACLVAFHHFNLEKALGGLALQKRLISFCNPESEERIELGAFPGLADMQYQAVINYAKMEKWPLTSQGLFFEIKRAPVPRDPTLLDAFYLTPEYHAISTLFIRSGLNLTKEHMVDLLLQGDWKMLEDFTNQQRQAQDLSVGRRRTLLLDYLNCRSSIAAKIFLETDLEFAEKRFDDAQVLLLLEMVAQENSPSLQTLAKALLASPRSDFVRRKAAEILYAFAGEPIPEPFDYSIALQRFAPQPAAALIEKPIVNQTKPGMKAVATTAKTKGKRMHVVQEGESLWKISRKYHVSVDRIMKVNHLESEKLRPGKQLEIPEK